MSHPIVVLSNAAQLAAFQSQFDSSQFSIYCDSGAFSKVLLKQNIPHEAMDDFTVQPFWDQANAWGCEKAYGWIDFCRKKKLFDCFDMPSATALYFSHFLIQGLKNYFFAEKIISSRPSKVVLFPQGPFAYPRFSGNHYLNYFLREFAVELKIPFVEIKANLAPTVLTPKAKLRRVFKNILKWTVVLVFRRPQKSEKIFVGSMKHLQGVMTELCRRGQSICFYDTEFHWDLFKKVRALKIPYLFPELLSTGISQIKEQDLHRRLHSSSGAAGEAQFFKWCDKDLTPFVQEMIFPALDLWIDLTLVPALKKYEQLFFCVEPKQVISEDDYALRGGPLAALAKKQAISFVTLSHANMAVDFSVPPSAQCFRQSDATIVNSENEKEMYVARGWDPNGFKVLGTPRFDFLTNQSQIEKKEIHSIAKLLYCANTYFKSQTPEDYGYLGVHIDSFDKVVQPSAEAIFRAVEQSTCELIIKPHNPEGLDVWRQKLNGSSACSRISLITDPHTPITAYLRDGDAMVLSYWSTAIFEAMLCGVPVIFVDLLGKTGKSVAEFEAKGYMSVARSEADLTRMIQNLRPRNLKHNFDTEEHFSIMGHRDGKSTARVADYLMGAAHDA